MSSIVKAKSIAGGAAPPEAGKTGEILSGRPERAYAYPDDQKQKMILQAIRKSQHIDNEALKRADDIVENAHRKSRQIIQDAEKNGFDQGYIQGIEAGKKAALQEACNLLDELRGIAEQTRADERAYAARHEKEIVMLSMEIARKILKQQILLDEDALPKMLDMVLREYRNEASIKIYLSEHDTTIDFTVNQRILKRIQAMAQNISVTIVKDDDVMMVETPDGIIDVSLKSQLEHIKEAMDHTL